MLMQALYREGTDELDELETQPAAEPNPENHDADPNSVQDAPLLQPQQQQQPAEVITEDPHTQVILPPEYEADAMIAAEKQNK